MSRRAIHAALELLEAGDTRGAELVLLDALDAIETVAYEPVSCDDCGREFAWPGLLEAHRHACVASWGGDAE